MWCTTLFPMPHWRRHGLHIGCAVVLHKIVLSARVMTIVIFIILNVQLTTIVTLVSQIQTDRLDHNCYFSKSIYTDRPTPLFNYRFTGAFRAFLVPFAKQCSLCWHRSRRFDSSVFLRCLRARHRPKTPLSSRSTPVFPLVLSPRPMG